MSNKELKHCPFCGSEEIVVREEIYNGDVKGLRGETYFYVECLDCDARTGDCFGIDADYFDFKSDKDYAIKSWNMRYYET